MWQVVITNKDMVQDHSWIGYCGLCSCGPDYIVEIVRKSEIRWNKRGTGKDKNSPYAKHLIDNFNREFWWFVLSCPSTTDFWKHKMLEASYIEGTLSSLRRYLANKSPLKMMKNAFYFTLIALLVLKIFKFLS